MREYRVGDVVRIKGPKPDSKTTFLGEPVDVRGYIYEVYDGGSGVSIITKNGVDLGGFSSTEQAQYLEFIKHSGVDYEFRSVMYLDQDWDKGHFKGVFEGTR